MKKTKLFLVALMALFSAGAMAQSSHVGAAAGTYTIGSATKPGSDTRFSKIADGVYLHRNGTFSLDKSKGLKTQNNTSGIVFYTTRAYDLTASVYFNATKNAEDVTVEINTITAAEYEAFFTGTENSTKVPVSPTTGNSFTVAIQNAKTSYSDTYTNLPAGYYYIVATGSVSNTYLESLTLAVNCEDAEASLSAAANAYVGDEVALTFASKNTGEVTYAVTLDDVDAAEEDYTIADGKFTALEAGTFVITATQAADGTYCAVEESVTIKVGTKTAVEEVSISGDTEGYASVAVTLTATAENATEYKWFVNNVAQSAEGETFIFTPAVAGTYSIVCKARNTFNAEGEYIASEEHIIEVSKFCGTLTMTLTGASAGEIDATQGAFLGTADVNTSGGDEDAMGGFKLKKGGAYAGIVLTRGTLQSGDIVTVTTTTASDITGGTGKLKLFSDKGTTLIAEADEYNEDGVITEGETQFILGTAANGATAVYLYRVGNEQNPYVTEISLERPCEASDDAEIKSLTINGEEVELDVDTYSYTVGATYAEETVEVNFTIHPLATANVTSPFTIATPAAGESKTATITVTAEDGTEETYTIEVTKSVSKSDNAALKALSVEGYTLDPEFAADVTEYTITKVYGAETPATTAVTATPEDVNATAVVAFENDVFTITVTAEDGETTEEYTITVETAAAKKDLLEAAFDNGVKGYIKNGVITVPYMEGETEPTFVSAKFWNADGEPTAAMEEGKLVVTGIDGQKAEYTIEYVALTPMELSYDEVTFEDVPSYIFSVYGWDADKGVKFSKDVEEASNRRISEGKDRIYIALPAAGKVILTSGTGKDRPVVITVNGVETGITKTAKANESIEVSLYLNKANLVSIESNGNNGDAGFIKLQLGKSFPTGIDNTEPGEKAVKFMENGVMYIQKNGVIYNAQGAVVR